MKQKKVSILFIITCLLLIGIPIGMVSIFSDANLNERKWVHYDYDTSYMLITPNISFVQDDSPCVITPETQNYDTTTIQVYTNDEMKMMQLSDYLIGVLASEMSPTWPCEALKAQAVAARTYVKKHLRSNSYIVDSELYQTLHTMEELQVLWGDDFDEYYKILSDIVIITSDQEIYYEDEYIEAVYFSTSSGVTQSSYDIWGYIHPYLTQKSSPWDQEHSNAYIQKYTFPKSIIMNTLSLDSITKIDVVYENDLGLIDTIAFDGVAFSPQEVTQKLGLRSIMFNITERDEFLIFEVYGYGHMVGMSQYGAYGMAKDGFNYIEILKYYYHKNIEIK